MIAFPFLAAGSHAPAVFLDIRSSHCLTPAARLVASEGNGYYLRAGHFV